MGHVTPRLPVGCPGNGSDKEGTDAPDVQEHPEVRRMGGEGNIIR